MQRIFLVLLTTATLLFSCKKDEEIKPEPKSETPDLGTMAYQPSTKGSWWVYDLYKRDTNGIETKMKEIDSFWVIEDTIIREKKYTVLYGHSHLEYAPFKVKMFRDSSGYLIDQKGRVELSLNVNYKARYHNLAQTDTLFSTEQWRDKNDSIVKTKAGDFNCLVMKQKSEGNSIKMDPVVLSTCYAKGVGRVSYQYRWIASNNVYTLRLRDYFIAE